MKVKGGAPGTGQHSGRITVERFKWVARRLRGATLLQSEWTASVSKARVQEVAQGAGSVTGTIGVILDPPYEGFNLYGSLVHLPDVEARARELGAFDWCRVCYFGYEADMPGWTRVPFKTKNGASKTTGLDGVWLSPSCLTTEQMELW